MDEVNNRAGEGDNIDECDVSWRPWKIAIMEAIIWNKKVFYEKSFIKWWPPASKDLMKAYFFLPY